MDFGFEPALYLAYFQMRRRARWSPERLARHRVERLARLRAHAVARSPFYREFHGTDPGRPFEDLPVLTKTVVMDQFDRLVTDRAIRLADVRTHVQHNDRDRRFRFWYRVQLSSGTTGRVGVTVFDRRAWLGVLSTWMRASDIAGRRISPTHRVRTASIAATSPWSTSGQISKSFESWWEPTIRMTAGTPLPEIVERLNRFQPQHVVTYASMVRVLATEQRAGRLAIRPRFVFSTGEVQTAEGRRLGHEAWGTEPFDEYAATETGALAVECREGRRRHLMDDLHVIEVVDADGRPVPDGEWGSRVLVTPLFNRITPLIRYELSDLVRLSPDRCRCGRTLRVLDAIEGRAEEVLSFPTADGGLVAIDPQVYQPVLDRLPVAAWQVRREDGRVVVLLAAPDRPVNEAAIAADLGRVLAGRGARPSEIQVLIVSEIERTAAGKAPVVLATRTITDGEG
jgi:phenylacetate-coenzyme A ligase PaaK-like adenylate-forming protein